MKQKRVVMIGLVIFICLGLVSLWTEADSQCEELTQAKQGDHAFPVCLEAAKKGNAYAQNIVGVSYAAGEGAKKNAVEALKWYRKSAQQGFTKAQSNIGLAFLTGDGARQNYAEAAKWWRLAADQGEPHAQYNLAVSYQCGCGIERNNALATKWYLLASFSYLKLGMLRNSLKSMAQIHLL